MPRKNPLTPEQIEAAQLFSHWRRAAGFNRRQLAKICGIDVDRIARWENCRRPIEPEKIDEMVFHVSNHGLNLMHSSALLDEISRKVSKVSPQQT